MIKVLCDRTLAFDHPTKRNPKQQLLPLRVIAKVGEFTELPDWAAQTDMFSLGVQAGVIKAFKDNHDSEKVGKLYEEEEELKKRIRALKEEAEMLEEQKSETAPVTPKHRGRKAKNKEEQTDVKAIYPSVGNAMPEKTNATGLGMVVATNPTNETASTEDLIEEQ